MADAPVTRSFVLGLDGVPWDRIERWTAAGELPHFATLIEEGASGPLESTIPPTASVAWPSITTGVRADKHGIYGFRRLTSSYDGEVNTSASLRQPPLWEIRTPAVVANVPMTYPASGIDGTLVSGMMTPRRDDGFTHPPAFADELSREVPDYEIGLASSQYRGREEAFIAALDDVVGARRRLMRHLMDTRDWSLFFFVYTAPGQLHQLVCDDGALLEHYRELDDIVGEVMAHVENRDANLFVVSAHGRGPVSDRVHVNTVLEHAGELARREASAEGPAESLGLGRRAVRSILARFNREGLLRESAARPVREDGGRPLSRDRGGVDVDFSSTRVFAHGPHNLYVNDAVRFADGQIHPASRSAVKREVMTLLESAVNPETGAPLLRVYDGSELFATDPWAPDIVLEASTEVTVSAAPSPAPVQLVSGCEAGCRSTGIFLAWGPNVAPRTTSGATVFDVVPTLLHSHLRSIPRDVDGRIIDVFRAGSPPAIEAPTHKDHRRGQRREPEERALSDLEDRLRGYGYIE